MSTELRQGCCSDHHVGLCSGDKTSRIGALVTDSPASVLPLAIWSDSIVGIFIQRFYFHAAVDVIYYVAELLCIIRS